MTIRRRLALSFLAILLLFGLNLSFYFWSNQQRSATVEVLQRALSRQILIASISQNVNDVYRHVALLGQITVEAPMSGAGTDEIARFNGRLQTIGHQIQELRDLSDSGGRGTVESLEKAYEELSVSWRTFYENLGVDPATAITELATHGEPLSQRILEQLAAMQENEKDRVTAAGANFYEVARLTDRMTLLIFTISTLLAMTVAYLVSRYLARGLGELKQGAALIGSGNLNHHIAIQTRDELGDLAQAFNSMTDKLLSARIQLTGANKELEAFSYSVSHDLRAPLRGIDGFSQVLLEDYADKLDAEGKSHLQRVRAASQRMAQLIDDMLNLSRVTRSEIHRTTIDLSALAQTIVAELHKTQLERHVTFVIAEGVIANGDARLLRLVLENLLGNAWKFTGKNTRARIEFGVIQQDGKPAYFVRDDGAGFEMAYADKLFGAFQRLHTVSEFEGTGVGLATVQRIIHRHGGHVWAEGTVEQGATFHFTL